MLLKKFLIVFIFLCCTSSVILAQQATVVMDTTGKALASKTVKVGPDTAKKYNPNVAVRRSAMLPGWGQVTNKKIWKIPIIYGALGTTGYLFFRNLNQYKEARSAYINATDGNAANDNLIKEPYYSVRLQPERIKSFRNSVRQNVDYSVLFFIAFWGLNVADAAVDANLKTFDVSDDLSFKIKAGYSPLANTNGVSLILAIR